MLTEHINKTIEEIKKNKDINGYITGSCLLPCDFDTWTQAPDIDIFVPNDREMVHAVDVLRYKYGFKLGEEDHNMKPEREAKKLQWLMQGKQNKKGLTSTALSTVKLHNEDGVIVNISNKYGQRCLAAVLTDFDMSIIMKGWDIQAGVGLDLTTQWSDNPMVAIPNPLRVVTDDMVKTAYFVRQFDRVIKYWDRGFDTRAVAKHDLKLIEQTMNVGNIWSSEASQEFFDKFAAEFKETKKRIEDWLKDKEDC